MAIQSRLFVHESDKLALEALEAIPGFVPLVKAFTKVWDEQQYRIENMSSNIRLSETQLPQYYNMLPPICEKLGIDVPELYLTLNVEPNAYTYGDTNPFIVIHSGLLELVPDHVVATVLAHECGHIACRHTLYKTLGRMVLNGTAAALGLSKLMSVPLQVAYFYWMRCSEYSADRAAIICDGSSDHLIEMCTRFAGYDKDIHGEFNVQEFLKQAEEYNEMVNSSAWNKTLEFMMYKNKDHPLLAVRAYEADQWGRSQQFNNIMELLEASKKPDGVSGHHKIMVPFGAMECTEYHYGYVKTKFRDAGFRTVMDVPDSNRNRLFMKNGRVTEISINGITDFDESSWFDKDSTVLIRYHDPD